MSRLGLSAGDVGALAIRKDVLADVDFAFVMTHLACADEPEHPLNAEQLARFDRMRKQLPRRAHLDRQLGRCAARPRSTAATSCGPASRCMAATRSAIDRTPCMPS